jgi:rhodanese-related sulfurtransferase
MSATSRIEADGLGAHLGGVDGMLERARSRIKRVRPEAFADFVARGGLVVDIRPAAQRQAEGDLPGAVVIERSVLEWRLDPSGSNRISEARGYDQPVLIVCSEGYASSLAAASLKDLGYTDPSDLEGGFKALRRQHFDFGAL